MLTNQDMPSGFYTFGRILKKMVDDSFKKCNFIATLIAQKMTLWGKTLMLTTLRFNMSQNNVFSEQ